MSAGRKESQPSIDDILSSIREIIADDSTEKCAQDGAEPHESDTAHTHTNGTGHNQSDILSVLRGGQEEAPEADPIEEASHQSAEDVMDLSEEFIVTDATAALQREQEGLMEVEADPVVQQDETEAGETAQAAESAGDPADDATITQAELWTEDFQMPVGDDGPTSPFTATQNNPESAWPRTDPFDVTESYKLARSQGMNARFGRSIAADDIAQPSEPAEEETFEESEEVTAAELGEVGVKLNSLSDTEPVDEDHGDHGAGASALDMDATAEQPASAEPAHARVFPDTEELEAVFGMPSRKWSGPSQPQAEIDAPGDEPAFQQAEEQPGQEFDIGEPDETDICKPDETPWDEVDESAASGLEGLDGEMQAGKPEPEPQQPRQDASAEMTPPQSPLSETGAQSFADEPAPSAPATMGSKTLEDSVKELLRPMLQEWLDKNMPRLVEAAMREHVAASQAWPGDEAGAAPAPSDDRRDDEG